MNTYLFVWNPSVWKWEHLEQSIEQLNKTGSYTEAWSCSSHKKVKPGDRAFLARVGKSPKGIIGSATITSQPFYSEFRSGEDKAVPRMRVVLDFDILLNAEIEPILTLDLLKQGKLSSQNWLPQSSGISIRPELVDELEAVWFDFITTQKIRHNPFGPAATEEQIVYMEGTPNLVTLTKYERNPFARKACISHYGPTCSVCDFNFEKVYGDIGKNFIHIHHLTQVAKVGKQYLVDPIKDLRPVCPNCHAMIHKKKEAIAIEELKQLLRQRSTNHHIIL
jgi:5-methylcytosine-specific restriction enzyme A